MRMWIALGYQQELGWLEPNFADPATPLDVVEWTIARARAWLWYGAVAASWSILCG